MSDAGVLRYGHRYFFVTSTQIYPIGPMQPMYMANRAWEHNLSTDRVRWIKNRDTGTMTPIDRREFFLVQMSATPLKYR